MSERKKFAIVEFVKDKSVEVVPRKWLIGNICFWPRGPNLTKLIKDPATTPEENWDQFEARLYHCYDNYEFAISQLSIAQHTSSLESEASNNRSKRKRKGRQTLRKSTFPEEHEDSSEDDLVGNHLQPDLPVAIGSGSQNIQQNFIVPEGNFNASAEENQFIVDLEQLEVPIITPCSCNCATEVAALRQQLKQFQEIVLREIKGISYDRQIQESEEFDFLPISCEADAIKTEELLSIEDTKKKLTKYLSKVGGSKSSTVTRRILARIYTLEFSRQVNFTGKGGKVRFSSWALMLSVIKDAVHSTINCSQTTDAEIEESIRNWFRYSGDRNGGRDKRRK